MKVVNNIAERVVALMDEYNKLHTNIEKKKQFMLLIVQHTGILTERNRPLLYKLLLIKKTHPVTLMVL